MPELTAPTRQQKITLGEMRSSGVRGLLVYCADYHCSHSIAIGADQWPDHLGSRIWNRGSYARPAVREAPTCALILTGKKRPNTRVSKARHAFVCEDCGWVCEDHPNRPWEGEHNEGKPAKIEKPKVWPRLYLGRSNRVREQ